MSIDVVGAIMGGMIVQFRAKFKMLTGFFDMVLSMERKSGYCSKEARTTQVALDTVTLFQTD